MFMEKRLKKLQNKKSNRKNNTDSSSKVKNGFARPTPISPQLSKFLQDELLNILDVSIEDVDGDTPKVLATKEKTRVENVDLSNKINSLSVNDGELKIARTEVTKLLNKYIKFHSLQDENHRKNILLVSKAGISLKGLLSPVVNDDGENVDLTFINIQKYIKHHFPKVDSSKTTPKVEVVVNPCSRGSHSGSRRCNTCKENSNYQKENETSSKEETGSIKSLKDVIDMCPKILNESYSLREKKIKFIMAAQKDLGFKKAFNLVNMYKNVIVYGCTYSVENMESIRLYSN